MPGKRLNETNAPKMDITGVEPDGTNLSKSSLYETGDCEGFPVSAIRPLFSHGASEVPGMARPPIEWTWQAPRTDYFRSHDHIDQTVP